MPSHWTDQADRLLLLTMVNTISPKISKMQWKEIATAMGEGYTDTMISQHFRNRLQKKDGSTASPAADGDGTKTPRKLKTAANGGSGKKSGEKRKSGAEADEDADDSEELESPSKKSKKEEVEDAGARSQADLPSQSN